MSGNFEAAIAADDARSVSAARESSGTCVDAAAWLNVEDEPDNPLVEGFIECGEVVAMVGQAKAGKSLLALQLAVCVAAGVPFLNRICKRQRVYLANLEVSEKQYKKRLRRVCRLLNLNPEQLRGWLFIDNMKGETASWNDALALCKSHNCTVAVIDPFYQIARIVETDEQQCLDAVEEMKAFARAGITLCVVFHSPKGFSGDRQLIDMISGSSILARFPESVIGLLNHATEKTARVVDAVLRNYPPPEPFAVSLAEGALELAPDILPEVATARNAWRRSEHKSSHAELAPYIIDVLKNERNNKSDFKGMSVGVLADKARKAYIQKTGQPLGEKRMPTEIKTLVNDKKLVMTERRGKNGEKLVGMPEDMEWWTNPDLLPSESDSK